MNRTIPVTSLSFILVVNAAGLLAQEESHPDVMCDLPDRLEINVVNIGQGDSTLVASPTGLLLADVGESYWNSHKDADKIHEVLSTRYGESCRFVDFVVISHFQADHIGYVKYDVDAEGAPQGFEFLGGLSYLVRELDYRVGRLLLRDYTVHNPNPSDGSQTFWNWKAYLASPETSDLNATTAELGDHQIELGSVNGNPIRVDIVQVDGATTDNPHGCDPETYFRNAADGIRGLRGEQPVPPSENDLSIAFIVSLGNFQMFIGGDTSGFNHDSEHGYAYHDTESCLADDRVVQEAYGDHLEVLRVNHHGSSHSTNQRFLDAFDPKVSIVSAGDENGYGHPDQEVMNRLLQKSVEREGVVILTEVPPWYSDNPNPLCIGDGDTMECARIADGEMEGDESGEAEIGDAGVLIVVSQDGSRYTILTREDGEQLEFVSE